MKKYLSICVGLACVAVSNQLLAQDAIVGKLGVTEVKISDLKRIVETQNPDVKSALLASLPDLERLVRSELVRVNLLAEAKGKGFDKRPEVQQQIDRAKDQALVEAYANFVARPPAEYPPEDEVKAFYEANKAAFVVPAQYRIAQVFFLLTDGGDKTKADAINKKAQDILSQAQKGTDFAQLAKENSGHAESAQRGGDMGWLAENQLIPEIRTTIAASATGKIFGPIKTSQGLHIVKLIDKKDPYTKGLADVRQNIVASLRYKKAQENERKYLEELSGKTPIAVNQIELARLQSTLK